MIVFSIRCVACIWCKKADCVVSPVIKQFPSINHTVIPHLIKFKNGHQLDCIDSKFFQIWDFFHNSVKCAGMRNTGRSIFCKTAYMYFVNDQIFHGDNRRFGNPPIKIVFHNPAPISKKCIRFLPPFTLSDDSFGIRIQKWFVFIK